MFNIIYYNDKTDNYFVPLHHNFYANPRQNNHQSKTADFSKPVIILNA
ncbi:hypothetical protein C942_04301 [Photobacterium marinum]|uniref:Uncharacterized protein n=1 Tax=Photobacterium marinum TaxID=1056511 RepID=L8JEA5_9GAMM|nr:hypothetical protein C942_04301 [Photobacterium marinum]